MNNWFIHNELWLRLGFFGSVFVVMALWEVMAPRRVLAVSKITRWTNNLGITIVNSLMLRLLFPLQAVGIALLAEKYHWGMFQFITLPLWLTVPVTIILLDALIYFQHRVFHVVPVFWQFHKMHHVDLDIDVTTGARFHPVEIALSLMIKMLAVFLLGPPASAVVLFEVLLNATAMFNHSNVNIPGRVDEILRIFIVTPDMHRVHHSVVRDETNSNYGFNLAVWDRLFSSYQPQPAAGHENMRIGLEQYRDQGKLTFIRLLTLPFEKAA